MPKSPYARQRVNPTHQKMRKRMTVGLPLFIEEIFLSFNPLRSLPNLMHLQKLRRFDIRATGIGAEKSRVPPECVVIAVGRRTYIDYLSSDEESEEDSE
jgi:hypothetical protein